MPIPVRCQCGSAFLANDELVGKRVACPTCQQPLDISPVAVAPQPPLAPYGLTPQPTGKSPARGSSGKPKAAKSDNSGKSGKSGNSGKSAGKRGNAWVYVGIGIGGTAAVMLVGVILAVVFSWTNSLRPIRLKGHTDGVIALSYSGDGQSLASLSRDGSLKIWDAATGAESRSMAVHANCVAYSPDGLLVATGAGNSVQLWNARTGEQSGELTFDTPANQRAWKIGAIAISPDNQLLAATAGYGGEGTAIWDLTSENRAEPLHRWDTGNACLAFSPDGTYLAGGQSRMRNREGGSGGDIWLRRVATGDSVDSWDPHSKLAGGRGAAHGLGLTSCLAFSPDGKFLASASSDTEALVEGAAGLDKNRADVKVWELPAGEERLSFHPEIKQCTALFFTQDGKGLIVAGGNPFITMKKGAIKQFEVGTGELQKTHASTPFIVESAAVSPSGEHFAWAASDPDKGPSTGQMIRRIKDREMGRTSSPSPKETKPVKMSLQISPL